MRHRDRLEPSADHVAAAAAVIGLLASASAAVRVLEATVFFAVVGTLIMYYREAIADRLGVEPAVDVIERRSPGLMDKDVQEFYTLHQEYLARQKEQREDLKSDLDGGGSGRPLNRQ